MFMVLAKMSPMSRELGMSTSSTFSMLSVERSSSRSPPSSSPSSRPPKKPGAGGFGSASPKKPLRVRKSRRGQEENREGTGQDRETPEVPRGRDREGAARRVRGVTMRAALDRIADESRSVDTRSRSGKTPARVTTTDRIDAGDPECAERGKRVDRARARTSRRTSRSSLVHASRSGSRALAGLCAARGLRGRLCPRARRGFRESKAPTSSQARASSIFFFEIFVKRGEAPRKRGRLSRCGPYVRQNGSRE